MRFPIYTLLFIVYTTSAEHNKRSVFNCIETPCQNGGICRGNDNGFYCDCPMGFRGSLCEKESCICRTFGQHYYHTYDGILLGFNGQCRYQLTGSCVDSSFYVDVDVKFVEAKINDRKIRISRNEEPVVVSVDGETIQTLPYIGNSLTGTFNIFRLANKDIMVKVNGRTLLLTDGRNYVQVELPEEHKSSACGICGNCNGILADDLVTSNGTDLASLTDISVRSNTLGNSWVVGGPPGCLAGSDMDQFQCSAQETTMASSSTYCARIDHLIPCSPTILLKYKAACIQKVCQLLPDSTTAKEVFCEIFEATQRACAAEDVHFYTWRSLSLCALECPAQTPYEEIIDNCHSSCHNLTSKDPKCLLPKTDGCACNGGLLESDGACVAPMDCGCTDNWGYHKIGESWLSSDCTMAYKCVSVANITAVARPPCEAPQQCVAVNGVLGCNIPPPGEPRDNCVGARCVNGATCVSSPGQFTCVCPQGYTGRFCGEKIDYCAQLSVDCKNGGTCVSTSQDAYCKCLPGYLGDRCEVEKRCLCAVYGDPTIVTFDGAIINFQGTCKYKYVQLCDGAPGNLEPFKINVKHTDYLGIFPKTSYPEFVELEFREHNIRLRRDGGEVRIYVDFEFRESAPVIVNNAIVIERMPDGTTRAKTTTGISISYDGHSRALIEVPTAYKGSLCGLCGDCDGIDYNDYKPQYSNFVITGDDRDIRIGNSYYIRDEEFLTCVAGSTNDTSYCPESVQPVVEANDMCGAILTFPGQFAACVDKLSSQLILDLHKACVRDACKLFENANEEAAKKARCVMMDLLAKECGVHGVPVVGWRQETGCDMDCPPGTTYKSEGTACPNTCADLDAEDNCSEPPVEGCYCPAGQILSDTQCILDTNECGCTDLKNGGSYYFIGQTWRNIDCTESGKCFDHRSYNIPWFFPGFISLQPLTCDPNARCEVVNEVRLCACQSGYKGDGQTCTIADICLVKDPTYNEIPRNLCANGVCITFGETWKCKCFLGWNGTLCDENIDECAVNPCQNGGNCTDLVATYRCSCPGGFTGKDCETNINDCEPNPCANGGTCTDHIMNYTCSCATGYSGKNCEIDIDDCAENPCKNGGTCTDLVAAYECSCPGGFTGKDCETNIDDCAEKPCKNDATCTDLVASYRCICLPGFTGKDCETNIDDCDSDPCVNDGNCTDLVLDYTCTCPAGYTGKNCETDIDDCAEKPCKNDATCTDLVASYRCICLPGFTGKDCETNIDDCDPDPCVNDGNCTDLVLDYTCTCPAGYTGKNCETDIDDCAEKPCKNDATCIDLVASYRCICLPGFTGKDCETNIDDCDPDPCVNDGNCTDLVLDYTCTCPAGYTGKNCETDIDDCAEKPCKNDATCIDLVASYRCICLPGFTGKDCETNIDDCDPDPCVNDGNCTDLVLDYTCTCPAGYTGKNCETDIDDCAEKPCKNDATCIDLVASYRCICLPGFTGKDCETNIDDCDPDPCVNDGNCTDLVLDYTCTCPAGYTGKNCETDIDDCAEKPCKNDATCIDLVASYRCICLPGFTGKDCETNIDDCDPDPCVNDGNCTDLVLDYTCTCPAGYTGKNCETDIDDCDPDPCVNDGNCTDLVLDYTCTCPAGYTGKNCETDIDDCAEKPCKNDGTCTDLVASYRCICLPGFTGKDCEMNIDDCDPDPCVNDGNCTDLILDYTCTCPAGYTGKNCETDIDDCAEKPCKNDATCTDLVASYRCICLPGFTGKDCETNIDDCDPDPCVNDGNCTDLVQDYTCTCPAGYTGKNCETDIDDCAEKPCKNDATCIDLVASYRCICLSGFTGKDCETNIDDCDPDPCVNGGNCTDLVQDYTCTCPAGYTGKNCEIDIDDCAEKPCKNDATCIDLVASYRCICLPGFTGKDCETNIDDCDPYPCVNGGNCTDLVQDYTCTCLAGYTGKNCEIDIDDCVDNNCQNDAECVDLVAGYQCVCLQGFTGQYCETDIDDCVDNNCQNDAECVDLVAGYKCVCLQGFTGQYCETDIDDCVDNNCQNDAECVDLVAGYQCACLQGFTGQFCETDIDDCVDNNCQNDAECVDLVAGYKCVCLTGFTGQYCETDIDDCADNNCQNGAECVDLVAGYKCICLPGFTGQYCETNIDDCDPYPCVNGGTCTDLVMDYSCSCVIGYTGKNCETDENDCDSSPCQHGGTCVDRLGFYYCLCPPGYYGEHCQIRPPCQCLAVGSSHTTYDGLFIYYQGICKYVLSQKCPGAGGELPDYTVYIRKTSSGVPGEYVTSVEIHVYGYVISLLCGSIAMVNGALVNTLPAVLGNGAITVDFTATLNLRVTVNFGMNSELEVIFDRINGVQVQAPDAYRGSMCGLCGDCNGVDWNDLRLQNGTDVSHLPTSEAHSLIGISFERRAECLGTTYDEPEPCSSDNMQVVTGPEYCGLLKDEANIFSQCLQSGFMPTEAVMNIWSACTMESCYALPNTTQARKVSCDFLDYFAQRCEQLGFSVTPNVWLNVTQCAKVCGPYMTYQASGPGCRDTCAHPNATLNCDEPQEEGCFCDAGMVLSGNMCVHKEECGCVDVQGSYHEVYLCTILAGL
ncbi:neurogenic locus notch homolog protein 2 isoform X4 [Lingula anatina]|uniref:Neurogenic locus notch homolog protein 2 isoform X4 n=1 Tax=Lingula anatina TaxID=7574 RepID=A0A1S3HQ50_LINAN|nr:neurogenic locus notch homolog protein 2 isoform X4 [Lingula anatina]|eukprot:XP_013388160.1 neurogenic locus notch homolog protein 2 isoform X4 [Lingula anatina]